MSTRLIFINMGLAAIVLAGCGQNLATVPSAPALGSAAALSAQDALAPAAPGLTMAQAAISADLAVVPSGLTATLSNMQIVPTPILDLYTFTATRILGDGHGLRATYLVRGTYSSRDGKVTVTSSTYLPSGTEM